MTILDQNDFFGLRSQYSLVDARIWLLVLFVEQGSELLEAALGLDLLSLTDAACRLQLALEPRFVAFIRGLV